MKRIEAGLSFNWMHRMPWGLSMLALVACLWSAGSIHSHEAGLHSAESACISCDLEDISTHGAALSVSAAVTEPPFMLEPVAFQPSMFIVKTGSSLLVRAPPSIS
ncbi:hypothetical protein [Mariprofundus micogutta]|nr:hypothetical protein [Mariprofundus micogutta]